MISADVFSSGFQCAECFLPFLAVQNSLPLGRAVSFLSAIEESIGFIVFEMSETIFFAGRYSTAMLLQKFEKVCRHILG